MSFDPLRQAFMVSAAFTIWCDSGASALLLVVALVLAGLWVCRRRPTAGAAFVRELDDGPDWEGVGLTTRYQRELAYRFKAEFGELRFNRANRIIAQEWCLRAMASDDVRYVDRPRLLPKAELLCLLPTRHAVEAAELSSTFEVRGRRAAVDLPK